LNVNTIEIRRCVSAALVERLNGTTAAERARTAVAAHNKALDDKLRGVPYPETHWAEYWYMAEVQQTYREPPRERGRDR
jgi:hypothetical protein